MGVFEELKSRGFCFQGTDEEELRKLLNEKKGVRFYVGFDPTGNSLHVGHLLPVMAMRLLQRAGHVPIVLVGGATARIGDPSGKSTARPMMTIEEIDANAEALKTTSFSGDTDSMTASVSMPFGSGSWTRIP